MQINSIYITMCLLIVTTMLFVATNADKFWPHHSRHHHRHHSHEKFHSRDYTSNSDENNSESHHFLSQPNAKGHHHRHDHHCGHHHYRSKETDLSTVKVYSNSQLKVKSSSEPNFDDYAPLAEISIFRLSRGRKCDHRGKCLSIRS